MSSPYRLSKADKQVIAAIESLLKQLSRAEDIKPAEMVSVAKVLHVLSRLPRVTEGVSVTIEISYRVNREGGSSSSIWHFFAGEDLLALSCGGFEYTDGVGSDTFTTMSWEAHPGERTEYDGSWDDAWMERDNDGNSDPSADSSVTGNRTISVEDDDNPLLFEPEPGEEEADSGTGLELYRRGEMIDLASEEWRAALGTFEDWGWEPEAGLDRYSTPLAFVKHDEGKAMQEAGHLLRNEIDKYAVLAQTLDLDIDLFFQLTQFVGRGAFIVGKPGAFENATLNDFQIEE